MTNLQIYEIKNMKRNLDSKIMNLIKEFEKKTCLEVVGIYIDRMDVSVMSGDRQSILSSVEIQAMLEPVIHMSEDETLKGGEE